MPADVYSLSVVLPLHNALLSKRGTPVNLFTRGVNRYANVAFATFAQVLPLSLQTFASHLRLANLVQIHFFVQNSCFITEYQNLWFIFDFICFYFILSLCVLTKTNFNSSLHKSTQYTFNSWAKTSSCQCCFRCQLDLGDTKSRL